MGQGDTEPPRAISGWVIIAHFRNSGEKKGPIGPKLMANPSEMGEFWPREEAKTLKRGPQGLSFYLFSSDLNGKTGVRKALKPPTMVDYQYNGVPLLLF